MIWLDIDPNVVKPGWTPLLITLGLGVAVVLLFISMRRQFRRINVPDDSVPTDDSVETVEPDQVPGSEPTAPPATPPAAKE